jgi:hypothetical protein
MENILPGYRDTVGAPATYMFSAEQQPLKHTYIRAESASCAGRE